MVSPPKTGGRDGKIDSQRSIPTTAKTKAPAKAVPLDLRSPGILARRPIIGVILFIFGLLVLGALTYNLYAKGPLLAWDYALAKSLPAIGEKSPPFVKYLMEAGFWLGRDVISVYTVLHAIYFIAKRYWQELTMLLLGVFGASSTFYVLSHIIGRQRPAHQLYIVVDIPGFPSGHTATTVAFYGLLAYLIVPKLRSTFWKAFVIILTLLVAAFIGFSRTFTAGHYLTDVLAGYGLGIAWCGLIYTLIELFFKKRRSRNGKEE